MSTQSLDQDETMAPVRGPISPAESVKTGRSPAKIAMLAMSALIGVAILGAWTVVLFWGLEFIGEAIFSWI